MRSYVVYPLIIFLSLMDAATLYDIFFRMSNVDEWILYLLTFGVAVVLNFIPLVLGRYIHYYRYHMNGVKRWMIVGLVLTFLMIFAATFYLRWETRGSDFNPAGGAVNVTTSFKGDDSSEQGDGTATAYTLLTGVIPLGTSIVNLALGYVISDPVKRRIHVLRYQKALLQEQINRMRAAEHELDQDWAGSLQTLEAERLNSARNIVHEGSEQIRQSARLKLAEKLGDPESISELTDT